MSALTDIDYSDAYADAAPAQSGASAALIVGEVTVDAAAAPLVVPAGVGLLLVTANGEVLHPDPWAAETGYLESQGVEPSAANGRQYQALTSGDSGLVEPVWPTEIGQEVEDGTVTWQDVGPLLHAEVGILGIAAPAEGSGRLLTIANVGPDFLASGSEGLTVWSGFGAQPEGVIENTFAILAPGEMISYVYLGDRWVATGRTYLPVSD